MKLICGCTCTGYWTVWTFSMNWMLKDFRLEIRKDAVVIKDPNILLSFCWTYTKHSDIWQRETHGNLRLFYLFPKEGIFTWFRESVLTCQTTRVAENSAWDPIPPNWCRYHKNAYENTYLYLVWKSSLWWPRYSCYTYGDTLTYSKLF